jgi:surface protein
MSVLRASNAPLGLDKGKPVSTSAGPTAWTIPSDWITFTPPSSTEQKVIGTVAVWNQDSNYLAFLITTTDASQYTVDWGDGTTSDHNSNTLAEKNYSWSSISSGTLTSLGYRQAIVTITPKISGRTFATMQLSRNHTGSTANATTTSPWLNLAISAPNATTIDFNWSTGGTTTNRLPARMLENINIVSSNLQNVTSIFQGMTALQNVNFKTSVAGIQAPNMFLECRSLRIAPALPPLRNSMNNMFSGCSSLQYVPLYNIKDGISNITTMQNTFSNCTSLQSVPIFDTSSVTNFSGTFNGCTSLVNTPKWDYSAAQTMGSMFSGCVSLESFPDTNTGSFLSNTGSMFNNCSSLKSVGLFNFNASGATASSMFTGCTSLETVPSFSYSQVTSIANMFQNCISLQKVPSMDLPLCTVASQAFSGCSSLREVGEINLIGLTSAGNANLNFGAASASSANASLGAVKVPNMKFTQSFQNCLMGATQLDEMYTSLATLNPAITNVSGNGTTVTVTVGTANIRPFVAGRSVTITGVDPVAYNISGTVASVNNGAGTFTITNAATGAYVSGGIASITSDRTITVTGNPGVATDNPTIATNKGWTVTG